MNYIINMVIQATTFKARSTAKSARPTVTQLRQIPGKESHKINCNPTHGEQTDSVEITGQTDYYEIHKIYDNPYYGGMIYIVKATSARSMDTGAVVSQTAARSM